MQSMIDSAKEEAEEEDDDELKKIVDAVKKTPDYKKKDKEKKALDKKIKSLKEALTAALEEKYDALNKDENETKRLVIERKWIATISSMIRNEMEQVTHALASEIATIDGRYAQTLGELEKRLDDNEKEVNAYLKMMGFTL